MDDHGILSARYAAPEPAAGYPADAPVIVEHASEGRQDRRADDDIEGGGMAAFLAEGGVIDPYLDPPPSAGELIGYAAARRWRGETAGTAWNGWDLPTDDRSQAKYMAELQAVRLAVRVDGDPWKFPHGFEPLTNAQIQEMAIAARAHVLACFAREGEVRAAIAAGTVTTFSAIDAAFADVTAPFVA